MPLRDHAANWLKMNPKITAEIPGCADEVFSTRRKSASEARNSLRTFAESQKKSGVAGQNWFAQPIAGKKI